MAQNVSDFLLGRLKAWGVRRIYGYPGDGINGILGAMGRAKDEPRFIQARHEELAAFMACAHGKFTGEVGVCLATSGPGAIHLLNGLYDAKLDNQPVVAIVGQQKRMSLGAFYQQEVDLVTLFKDVSEYVEQVNHPAQIRTLVDVAFRTAMARHCVCTIIVPADVQELAMEEEAPRKHGVTYSGVGYAPPRIIPEQEDLLRAAEVLNSGKKVAMLVGAGTLNATDEVIQTAELLGAGVAKALLGKAAVPDDIPYVTGSIGLLGTKPSWDMMMQCDTLLMVGTSFPYAEFLPKPGQARGVQIDRDARKLSLRYPCEVNLHGDAKLTLEALLPLLKRKADRSWQKMIEGEMAKWWPVLEARAMVDANPVNPQRVFHELSPKLPDNVILCADSGSSTNWWARDLKIRRGMMASLSGNLATMGPGSPYALAAKFAFPDRPVLATVGDGAMQMNGNNVLITVAKYWKEWKDPRLIFLILNNRDLNQVTWEQRIMNGDPKFDASQSLPDFPYAQYAQSVGLGGVRIEHPAEIGAALDEALTGNRPYLVEVMSDPEVPPLPPHISFEQAVHFWRSVFRGDSDRWNMMGGSIKELVATYAPQLVGASK
ncbi:MAG TPA: thiamine pyrophosphate-requiring protein [Tepidisphaeraceae bacterium]|nr:thiamine pyrophosphate-requiring protein [Tepidisphaeraceae bacterium]